MAAPSKAQLLTDVYTLLKKRYKLAPRTARLTVLEAVVYGICHEATTREHANQALARFKDEFFDWNEVRVSSVKEIQGVLDGIPDLETRAQQVRRFLRQLFSRTYGFTLEGLVKKPLKEAVKALQEFEAGSSDFVLATVIQQALGGHAIPIDAPLHRVLVRLGLTTPEADLASTRAALERAVPKNRGQDLSELLEELAHDTCVEGEPHCERCILVTVCPTGKERAQSASASKGGRSVPKPKATASGRTQPDGAKSRSAPPPRVATKGKPRSPKKG